MASASRRPTDIVIFGASGDLTRRKILPAIGDLSRDGQIRLLGAGRSSMSQEAFKDLVASATGSQELAARAGWVQLDYASPETYEALKPAVDGDGAPVIYYLATPPATFGSILTGLTHAGLSGRGKDRSIVVEKPLGQDASSARTLNEQLEALFDESQIFRIDHYLAKDTVQNVLAFRFSNSLFEPVWNRTMIESIQITAAEEIDIGKRAG